MVDEVNRVKEAPKSREAEQSVIGALLLDNSAWERIADRVHASDFFYQNHRTIFAAMMSLAEKNKPFDAITLIDTLRGEDSLEDAGGKDYIRQLGIDTPSAVNIVAYADIVRQKAILRELIAVSGDISNSAFFPEGRDVKVLLDGAEQKLFAIANKYRNEERDGFQSMKSAAAAAISYIDEVGKLGTGITGYATGFDKLDDMTSGLQPGDLIIIAGRPSMGKTTLAMNIIENIGLYLQKPVAIFSLEMPARMLAIRMLAAQSGINLSDLIKGKIGSMMNQSRLQIATKELCKAPIFIDDGSNISPMELRARARRLHRQEGGLGAIMVDYLQLMSLPDSNENRATQISDISRSLKLLAKELHVPVIALSQLNRSLESRPDKRPIMSDIRESGAIEQDADLIMFVYRDEVYNENTEYQGIAEIIIGKQRNGPIGKVFLQFQGSLSRFGNLATDYHAAEE
ncbi:MAG: replicative DNA helicase [Cardiobacteriales bacterium]|nr:MAG: replicative DNA helicase [Cardiobacteriales bacterium]